MNEDDLTSQAQSSSPFKLGCLAYRDLDTHVYGLAALFGLAEGNSCTDGPLLVFVGSDSPWAVKVDHVDGVVDAARIEFQDLPTYLVNRNPAFVLVCEAEFALVAVPADKVLPITKADEISSMTISECNSQGEACEIDGRDYRLLDLNRVLEDLDFTVCGLKD